MKTKEEKKAKKKAYNAAYRAAHLEEEKSRHAAYRAANPEKVKARSATRYVANREKLLAGMAAYYAANKKKEMARVAAWQKANPEKVKASRRRCLYGLSPEDFQLMLAAQKNACGICKETFSKPPHIDHCHKTGEVRGLLCGRCNVALGGFRDSPEILDRAKKYLTNA